MLRTLLVALMLSLFVYLPACSPTTQKECGFVQNVYNERISWKGEIPVVMSLDQSVPEEYIGAAQAAAATWNAAAGRKLFEIITEKEKSSTGAQKDNKNVIYFYNSWEADKTNEQARTSVYWVGDQIKEADIRINAKDFKFYWNQKSDDSSAISIESLILHEMGHVLGLKHKDGASGTSDANSVMVAFLSSNTKRIQVAQTDVDSLKCEY